MSLLGFLLPAGSNSLPLSVELNSTLAIEVRDTPHAILVASEGEHREGNGDGQVDSELASLDLSLPLAGGVAILGEDSSSISPPVIVDQIDGFLERVGTDDNHNWSENFLVIDVHAWLHVINDGWSNPISIGVALNLNTSSIEEQVSLIGAVLDQTLNLSQVFRVVKRGDIGVIIARANREALGLLDDLRDPLGGVSDHDNDGDGHAALAGGTEAGTDDSVNGILFVGVWHHDGVILGAHVDLAALALGTSGPVDILTGLVGTNEADALDVGMGAHLSNRVTATLDDVDDTIGDTGLLQQIDEELGGASNSL